MVVQRPRIDPCRHARDIALLVGPDVPLQPLVEMAGSAPCFSERNRAKIEYCFFYSTNKPIRPAAGRFMSSQLPGNGSADILMHGTGSYRKHTRTQQPFENAVQCKCFCYGIIWHKIMVVVTKHAFLKWKR